MVAALAAGNQILAFGNGGSAADAQHFAAELVVRYERNRPARSAIALTTDTSILTAAGNDTRVRAGVRAPDRSAGPAGRRRAGDYDERAHRRTWCKAIDAANARGLVTIALTGRDGGEAGRQARRST